MSGRNLSKLTSLRDDIPAKLMRVVRLAWPEIKAARRKGHTLKVIHSRLAECGIVISYRLLTCYVSRLRREDRSKNGPSAPSPGKPFRESEESAIETNEGGRDPLANIRERLVLHRPGFHFDDGLPDHDKLIGKKDE